MDQKQLAKWRKRLWWMLTHGLQQALVPLGQFVVSFVVLTYADAALWGQLVYHLMLLNLAVLVVNWGQNTYLLRAFSEQPQRVMMFWQMAFFTRLPILGLLLLLLSGYYWGSHQVSLLPWMLLWLLGQYGFRAFDALHLHHRKFEVPIGIELLGLLVATGVLYLFRTTLDALFLIQLYVAWAWWKCLAYWWYYYKTIHWEVAAWRFDWNFLKGAFPFFFPAFVGFIQARMDLYGVAYYLSDAVLGGYQIFFKIIFLTILVGRVLLGPFLKNLYRLSNTQLLQASQKFWLLGALGTIPYLLLFYYLLPWIYGLYFSWKYYCLAYFVLLPFWGYAVQTHLLIKLHLETYMAGLFLLALCFNAGLNAVLIPSYGALGALGATALVQWGLFFSFSYLSRRGQEMDSKI